MIQPRKSCPANEIRRFGPEIRKNMKKTIKKPIIDFHTHAFPEKIASRTLELLRDGMRRESGRDCTPASDGTAAGLVSVMDKAGIDISVVMPIVTKPAQTGHINEFAADLTSGSGGRLISFGSVHPSDPDAPEKVDKLAASGFCGIKLHPEFQKTYIDSPECISVLRRAAAGGLAVTVHAGADIGLPPPVHCTPDRILHVLDAVPGLKLIAAHLGGWMMWDDVAEKLCTTPVYFDTAFIADFIDPTRAKDIITAHTAKKVLFGSDCPWEDPAVTVGFIRSLGLSAEDTELILGKNAEEILKLNK